MDKDKLKKLAIEGKSTREISEELNKSQTNVMYWLKKYGIKTQKAKKNYIYKEGSKCKHCGKKTKKTDSKFCSNTCFANQEALEFGNRWKTEGELVLSEATKRTGLFNGKARRYIFLANDNRCQLCGWTHDFGNGTFPPLEVSHIDNNYSNNSIDNLLLLCPNCHAVKTREQPIPRGFGRWSNNSDSRNYHKGE